MQERTKRIQYGLKLNLTYDYLFNYPEISLVGCVKMHLTYCVADRTHSLNL